jgi:hypothetical protein
LALVRRFFRFGEGARPFGHHAFIGEDQHFAKIGNRIGGWGCELQDIGIGIRRIVSALACRRGLSTFQPSTSLGASPNAPQPLPRGLKILVGNGALQSFMQGHIGQERAAVFGINER